jgi:hypothetical protein
MAAALGAGASRSSSPSNRVHCGGHYGLHGIRFCKVALAETKHRVRDGMDGRDAELSRTPSELVC